MIWCLVYRIRYATDHGFCAHCACLIPIMRDGLDTELDDLLSQEETA